MSSRPLHILLLCHFYDGAASTIIEHIHAFPRFSRNRYYVLNNLGDLPWWLDLDRFDGVIIHYSLVASYDNYISPQTRKRLRDYGGYKMAFVQDDYRWIDDTVNAFAYMRINALFGLAGPDIIDQVYSPQRLPGVRRETVLTGYVPEELNRRPVLPLAQRPIDVGYRARKLPAWIGSHTLQKWQIADRFLQDGRAYGLKMDISYREEDRIYGEDWINFVSSCKAVLGTESGASVCDFTGDIQRNVEAHVKRDPDVSFETLRDLYFGDVDGKILMNVISPRCFEAAALRTLMIFYEGHYSGVLKPWQHYVPLKTDHSNMADVVRILRDPRESQAIVDRAFNEVALNPAYTFRAFVQRIDRVFAEDCRPSGQHDGYSEEEFSWRLSPNPHDLTRYGTITQAPVGEAARPLLRKASEPAAVLAPIAPGQRIEVVISPPIRLRATHLVWSNTQASLTSAEIVALRRGRAVRRWRSANNDPVRYTKVKTAAGAPVDQLFVTFGATQHAAPITLDDLRFDGDLHWIEQGRQLRESLRAKFAEKARYFISDLWMSIPEPIRIRTRAPVRKIYDLLVGKRD